MMNDPFSNVGIVFPSTTALYNFSMESIGGTFSRDDNAASRHPAYAELNIKAHVVQISSTIAPIRLSEITNYFLTIIIKYYSLTMSVVLSQYCADYIPNTRRFEG